MLSVWLWVLMAVLSCAQGLNEQQKMDQYKRVICSQNQQVVAQRNACKNRLPAKTLNHERQLLGQVGVTEQQFNQGMCSEDRAMMEKVIGYLQRNQLQYSRNELNTLKSVENCMLNIAA